MPHSMSCQKYENINNKKLEKWLKSRFCYSDNIFEDPGYSNNYKSKFGLTCTCNDNIYQENDIDHKVNIGHVFDNNGNSDDIDRKIEQYIDYVLPEQCTHLIDNENIHDDNDIHNISYPIVVLPGSNHSNANYLYKLIIESIEHIDPYTLPIISKDHTIQFNGDTTMSYMKVNKNSVYNFVRLNSWH